MQSKNSQPGRNLFIIGNGFDRAHELPTSYEHFREFLKEAYPGADKPSPSFTVESTPLPNGGEMYNKEDVASVLLDVISEAEEIRAMREGVEFLWRDFEKSLGELDFERYLDDMALLLDDDEDDDDMWKRAYRNEDASAHFYKVAMMFKELFEEWVVSIDVSDTVPKEGFQRIIDEDFDVFLSFNYTYVLEEIYDAHEVCHIHGSQYTDDIIVGHGEDSREYENSFVGSEMSLYKVHEDLRKDTQQIISETGFFEGLSSIDSIYSIGFSFSPVDLPYIKEMMEHLDTKEITWFLNDFDGEEKREGIKNTLREIGFKGEFDTFSIEG